MEKVLVDKIEALTILLSDFEKENSHVFKNHKVLVDSLELAKQDYKNYLLKQNSHLKGLLCTTPNGKKGEIVDVRISGKGGNVICKVKTPSRFSSSFTTTEFNIDQLQVKQLPDVIRNIYRANKK